MIRHRCRGLAWALALGAATAIVANPALADDATSLDLRGRVINTATDTEPTIPKSLRRADPGVRQLWLVQFTGPVERRWIDGLEARGLRPVMLVPPYGYVVQGDQQAIDALKSWEQSPAVQWVGPYRPGYRISPQLQGQGKPGTDENVRVTVQVVAGQPAAVEQVQSLGTRLAEPTTLGGVTDVVMRVKGSDIGSLAQLPAVINVEPRPRPHLNDEVQNQIVAGNASVVGGKLLPTGTGYLQHLTATGVSTTPSDHPIVAVTDDGIDDGTTSPDHPDFYQSGSMSNPSRVVHVKDCTTDNNGQGAGGHGTINAGIVGGYNDTDTSAYQDANGYQYGLGVDPWARLANIKIFSNSGGYDLTNCGGSATDAGMAQAIGNSNAAITNNSWGADSNGAYTSTDREWDFYTRDVNATAPGLQPVLHVFSAGNKGPGATTIGSPANAKNVLTVGATENVRDQGVSDGCYVSEADNAADMASFSSRGPTADLRAKPEIVAAGTHVQGPASQVGFTGASVCGSSSLQWYPLGQTLYTWSSGTSHSSPAVAGAAALVYEYYKRELSPGNSPSPAMLKALLLNSARYLNGSGSGGTLPGTGQGWGTADLGGLHDATRWTLDQTRVFSTSGDSYTRNVVVSDSGKPTRVTLAWTDAPGSTVGDSYVNNLDLEVTAGGQVYRGNVFSGGLSATGGSADVRNNVEQVWLPAGISGRVTIKVNATNIAGDAIPGNGIAFDQDFALTSVNLQSAPVVSSVLPASGPAAGGTSVTVSGTGFDSGASVLFGGSVSTVTGRAGSTGITVSTPAHAAGVVDVVVRNSDDQASTLTSAFTYEAPVVEPTTPPTEEPVITPGPVQRLTVTKRLARRAVIRWQAPATPVTSYSVRVSKPNSRSYRPWTTTTKTRKVLRKLRPASKYRVQVKTVNASAVGPIVTAKFRTRAL